MVARLQVTLTQEQHLAHVIVRRLQVDDLTLPASSRVVIQLNFTSWPHHGVPEHCLPLLQVNPSFAFTLYPLVFTHLDKATVIFFSNYCINSVFVFFVFVLAYLRLAQVRSGFSYFFAGKSWKFLDQWCISFKIASNCILISECHMIANVDDNCLQLFSVTVISPRDFICCRIFKNYQ